MRTSITKHQAARHLPTDIASQRLSVQQLTIRIARAPNNARPQTAVHGSPISRVNNLTEYYT